MSRKQDWQPNHSRAPNDSDLAVINSAITGKVERQDTFVTFLDQLYDKIRSSWIRDKSPGVREVLSFWQRSALDFMVLRRLSERARHRIHAVDYTIVCIAQKSGFSIMDIVANPGPNMMQFHVEVANRSAKIDFGDGFKASNFMDHQVAERRFLDEAHRATTLLYWLTMANSNTIDMR